MIGTIEIKVNAAKPNFPLQPMFAFQGSPSSIRVLEVPKKIGDWNITSVKVVVQYPDNTTIEKVAVRTGAVWVATFDGCEIAGKVGNGLSIIADGIDEDGNEVTGYVLGKGDVFILENDTDISRLLEKTQVRYIDDIPDVPTKGDLMNSNGELRLFDGNDWILISTGEHSVVYDSQITIQRNGTSVGSFTTNSEVPVSIDIPVPSRTSDIQNDSGFITVAAIPSNVTAFNNDAGYITASALPTKVSELENDSGYITESAIPSNVGAFQNDVGYLTSVSWGEVQDKPDVALMSDIPSNVSELENDSGYITTNALPTKVSELQNDVGFITANAISGKRDYTDLSYNKYNNSDNTYKGIESWNINGLKIGSQTYNFTTTTRGNGNPTYGTYWNDGTKVVYTHDLNTFFFANGGDALTSFTFNESVFDYTCTWEGSSGVQNVTFHANTDFLALKRDLPAKVSELENDVGYLTTSSSAFVAKRDKSDLVYKVGFDKNNLDKVVKFVVEYVDGNNQNVTATLDKYDQFTQTWTGDNTNWKVYTYLAGMEGELYFALDDGTDGRDAQPAPSQGAEDTSWNFIYNSNPATWTMVMTQNIAIQQDFKNLRDMKDISYPASVDSTGMYTIQKFNVNGTEVAHFTTSGSTSTWDTNDPVVDTYEISTTDGTNFTLVSNGIQLGTFTMTSLKNGVVDVTYDGNTYTVGATFKQTTFALKDYVDSQIGSVLNEQF